MAGKGLITKTLSSYQPFQLHGSIEALTQQNLTLLHTNNKGVGKTVHSHVGLISTFVIHHLHSITSSLISYKISIFWLVSEAEEAVLSITCLDNPKTGFQAMRPKYIIVCTACAEICGSRSAGSSRSKLIWIYTVLKKMYPGSAGQVLRCIDTFSYFHQLRGRQLLLFSIHHYVDLVFSYYWVKIWAFSHHTLISMYYFFFKTIHNFSRVSPLPRGKMKRK